MRCGFRRGWMIATVVGLASMVGSVTQSRADLFHHTIPREVPAMDYRTGDVMYAPPIPGGLYTADPIGCVKNAGGLAFGSIHGLAGKLHGLCSKCGGPSCGQCGGRGLFHGKSCGLCGGDGCGKCGLSNLFHHGDKGCGSGTGCLGDKCGLGHGHGGNLNSGLGCGDPGMACVGPGCGTLASTQVVIPAKSAPVIYGVPSPQSVPSVCGGCLGTGRMLQGGGCGLCGGSGFLSKLFCGKCKGTGCGECGAGGFGSHGCGSGCFNGHHGAGCRLFSGNDGLCRNCGGRGCQLCARAKSLLHAPHALVGKLLHKGDIKYFVGAGGPVPLTPGYVPYVVPTRSPRDYFAFPPFSDQVP